MGQVAYAPPSGFIQTSASSETKPALLSPGENETILCISEGRDGKIVEVPIVNGGFRLRVSGSCKQNYYGGFSVRIVGYRA